ncbi:MAG: hypothetical protein QXE84_03260 [Candidatus Nitrosotenuis sp.]|nr:hypothetical protein [Candidatus Nitrosotenuis sp.]
MQKIFPIIIGIIAVIVIIASILFTNSGVFQYVSNHSKISLYDAIKISNNTASKHGSFNQQITWHVHILSDGKIQVLDETGKKSGTKNFSCQFSLTLDDVKDHFAYMSVFRNNDTGYVVLIDTKSGQIIESKPVSLDSAVCGP